MSLISNNSTYVQFAFGAIVILISLVLLRRGRRSKLNEPPLVPYKYPIIGHTIDYYKDNKAFINKCQENYGEIFSLYVFGKTITFVGKELTSEVFKHHQTFDFAEAAGETFPMNEFMRRPSDFFNGLAKVVQANLSGKLVHYIERVQRQLIKSIENIIGDGKVVEPPMKFFQFIVAKPIAATLIGEELSEDKDLVNTFAYATTDLSPFLAIPPIFSFIHPMLHTKLVILAFRYLNNPYKIHRELIKQRITPVIEKRLSEMRKLGDSYTPPIDILQKYIETCSKDYVADIDAITDYMIAIIFASVHTTSRTLTYCVQEFVNHPQFQKEILDEIEQLHKTNEGSYYSIEQIAKLEKLDSFIRETLRYHSQPVSLKHKIVAPHFTFSNGYQVPKGRIVSIREEEIHFDEELQGQNPNEFGPFRHLNGSSATRIERNYVVFGLGKHACPGRFFAINEIKMALHHILLKYNVRKADEGKIYPITFGPMKHPNGEGLIFEKKE